MPCTCSSASPGSETERLVGAQPCLLHAFDECQSPDPAINSDRFPNRVCSACGNRPNARAMVRDLDPPVAGAASAQAGGGLGSRIGPGGMLLVERQRPMASVMMPCLGVQPPAHEAGCVAT